MHTSNVINRVSSFSKIAKFNIMILALLMIAGTMMVSFATTTTSATGECGAHVALVLDRSSSIGVDRFSSNPPNRAVSDANINAIKVGANDFVQALKGKDSYTDVYAFASVAERINKADGWFNLKDQASVGLQKWVIGGIKFKQGANSGDENAYWDGMSASAEGLTNWQGALNLVGSTRQNPFPSHLVFFTDGNPTTNQREVAMALAAGGSFTAAGLPSNTDETDADDLSEALLSADFLRAIGVKIIPIGVGQVNRANLQALAGPGNPVYLAPNYSELSNMFKTVATNICEPVTPTSQLRVIATEEGTGKTIAAKINQSDSPFPAGAFQTNGQQGGWATKTAIPTTNWGFTTTLDLASVPGYTLANVYCRQGPWASTSPVTGEKVANGIKSSAGGYVPGAQISCEYVLRKAFVPNDGIEIIKDVTPTTAKRGEAVTYSFVVKNTGNTKLTNIKINDPMLGGQVGATIASLEVGATSAPITKSYTIPNNATGTIRNVATATGTPVNPDGTVRPNVKDDDPADVIVALRDGQTIEKSVRPSVAPVGAEVTYTISVKNTGEAPISNVLVTDATINKELTIAGPIAPGATGSVQVKYILKAGDFKEGVFTNVACLKGTQTCDDAKVSEPKVELIKSGPATARPGEKVTYTFKVKNVGIVDLTNIKITDATLSSNNSPVVINVEGTLKPGQTSVEKTYEFTIPANFEGNIFKNVAVVTSNPIDPETKQPVTGVEVRDEDDHNITLIKWTATKTADKSVVVPGTTVTYTITVKNTGGTVLKNIEVSDPTIGFPEDGKPVVIATLAAGESKSVTATYVIPSDFDGDTFKNVALVCIPAAVVEEGISAGAKDCQRPEAEVDLARISLTKTADKDVAFPGEKVIYTFVVENTGSVDIDPSMINDDILGEIGDPGVLKPGEKATFTKVYTVDEEAEEGDEVVNTATVCAPVPGSQLSVTGQDCKTICPANSDTVLCDQDDHTLVVQVPSITIVKTANIESASVGDTVVYTFLVTNTSEVTLTDISVTDNVLGDLGTIEKLEPGETGTKSIDYVVTAESAAAGTVVNVATACFAVPEFEDNCASDDHSLTVVAVGGVAVTRPPAVDGQQLPFTGAQSGWLALIAGLLIALGGVLFFITRRRKNEAF